MNNDYKIKFFSSTELPNFKLDGNKPKYIYFYTNESGENQFCVARYEQTEFGEVTKNIRPWFNVKKDNKLDWVCKWLIENERPIYRLADLIKHHDKPVLVVEGEKNADDARELLPQYVVITSSGGANAAKKTDWSHLAGRDVTIWPDNDYSGKQYKNDVVQFAIRHGAKNVSYLMIPEGLPQGFDISDAISSGWDKQEIEMFIAKNTKKAKKLPVLTLEELYNYKLPERTFYYPWFRAGSLNMIYAQRGLGKTFFALGFATSLIQGKKFLCWECEKEVAGLYVDGEMSLSDIKTRLQKFLPIGAEHAGLDILSHEELYHTEEKDLSLMPKEKIVDRIKNYLTSNRHIKFIVLDNLSCLYPSLAEDKRDDWASNVQPFLLWCRNSNIAVLIVHHANKKGEQRGSGAKEDSLDIVIELSPVPETEDNEGARFYMDFRKTRAITADIVPPLEVKLLKNGSWEWKEKEKASIDALYQLVCDGIETVKDAAELMGLSDGQVSKLKKKLVKKGLLRDSRNLVLK